MYTSSWQSLHDCSAVSCQLSKPLRQNSPGDGKVGPVVVVAAVTLAVGIDVHRHRSCRADVLEVQEAVEAATKAHSSS